MLKNISRIIKTGVCVGAIMMPLASSLPTSAAELPETRYTFNKPTEITITKIDFENNKFWVRILADGKTSGTADKYTYLNLLGVGSDDGTRMTDELLSYRAYGRDYIGDSLLFLYNVQNRETEYTPREQAYEFTATRSFQGLKPQWYYWAPMAAPTGGDYIVVGRIDFSECAEFVSDKTGYTCEVEDGENGLYKYGPHDAEGNRVLMPSEIVVDEPDKPGEATSDSEKPSDIEGVSGSADGTGEKTDTDKTDGEEQVRIVEKEVPVEKVVEREVIITKNVMTPVETVRYIYQNVDSNANLTASDVLSTEGDKTAEQEKNALESEIEALKGKIKELEEADSEVEVPNLSGIKEERDFNFWWIIVLVLAAASLSFWLLACLKQSKSDER